MLPGSFCFYAFLFLLCNVKMFCFTLYFLCDPSIIQCCNDNRIGSCLTGSASDNRRCNSLCTQCSDKGGHCKLLKSGKHACHCMC
ncbi:hypothetical protein MKW98_013524 [Papaver atlanticum]|uniref:Uncharacterized protein n=1 Tax=Papaver atlanticum TaxID=357466 RepID=A0AAD4XLX5_9MAGN|nr:hypothetical protein MKW98_013524 [Papaver atlanticum]